MKNFGYIIFLAIVAALGGFLFGYDTAVISGTVTMVKSQFGLDVVQTGWYVGCALVGSIVGVLCAGVLSDGLGRKLAMLISAVLFSASAIGCAVSVDTTQLVIFRIVGGVGIGVASIVSPLYISEIAAAKYRGRLVSLYQLAVTVGFLAAYLVNYEIMDYSAVKQGSAVAQSLWSKIFVTESWRGMLGAETLPAVLFMLALFFIPESPRWLTLKGRGKEALALQTRICGSSEEAQAELDQTSAILNESKESTWKFLMRPNILKAIAIGAAIAILGQFMGVNAVMYYGPVIFEDSGMSTSDSLFYQIFIGLVNVGTTIIALLIIDKVGRKQLVYWGVSGMIISLLLISGYFVMAESLPTIMLLIFFLMYVFSTAISISAVIFVLLSEMYPIKVRGVAMSIAGLSLWVGTFLIGQLTPWMLEMLQPVGTFLLFAVMCIPYMLIIRFLVPDTTGKSLEEIERYWQK